MREIEKQRQRQRNQKRLDNYFYQLEFGKPSLFDTPKKFEKIYNAARLAGVSHEKVIDTVNKINERLAKRFTSKNPSIAQCKKLIEQEKAKEHKPTISHYRDMENGINKSNYINGVWVKEKNIYYYEVRGTLPASEKRGLKTGIVQKVGNKYKAVYIGVWVKTFNTLATAKKAIEQAQYNQVMKNPISKTVSNPNNALQLAYLKARKTYTQKPSLKTAQTFLNQIEKITAKGIREFKASFGYIDVLEDKRMVKSALPAISINPNYGAAIRSLKSGTTLKSELTRINKELQELVKESKSKYANADYYKPRIKQLESAIKQGLKAAKNPTTKAAVKNSFKQDVEQTALSFAKELQKSVIRKTDNESVKKNQQTFEKRARMLAALYDIHLVNARSILFEAQRKAAKNPTTKAANPYSSNIKQNVINNALDFALRDGKRRAYNYLNLHREGLGLSNQEWIKLLDKIDDIDTNKAELLKKKYNKNSKNFTHSDFKAHQKLTLEQLGKMFQGESNGLKRRVIEADITPNNKFRLGHLVQMKIKRNGQTIPIEFDGESLLSADTRRNLWVSGKDAILDNSSIRALGIKKPKKNGLEILGDLIQVDYVTAKKHIENGETVRFYHKLGEATGERPKLAIDYDGFPIILGGSYDVWNVGIVN